MRHETGEFGELLTQIRAGDALAEEQLWEMVYQEIKNLARRRLGGRPAGTTLSATALVHEVYLKIGDQNALNVKDRGHFMALVCRVMRQVMVQNARYKGAQKRGEFQTPLTLGEPMDHNHSGPVDLIALNRALKDLHEVDPRLVTMVECRFFGGLSAEETARVLDVSVRTVERGWTKAKLYLLKSLRQKKTEAGIV